MVQVTFVKKIIVVCPTSLVNNWGQEFKKWLKTRVKYVACNGTSQKEKTKQIKTFNLTTGRDVKTVLIISYESLRLYIGLLKGPGKCDLLICDEAHRLKNDQTLVNQALDSLDCDARVLLSGTPLQNDLEEFYCMSAFTMRHTSYEQTTPTTGSSTTGSGTIGSSITATTTTTTSESNGRDSNNVNGALNTTPNKKRKLSLSTTVKLPTGWVCKVRKKKKTKGKSAGRGEEERYYMSPDDQRFRSIKDIENHLGYKLSKRIATDEDGDDNDVVMTPVEITTSATASTIPAALSPLLSVNTANLSNGVGTATKTLKTPIPTTGQVNFGGLRRKNHKVGNGKARRGSKQTMQRKGSRHDRVVVQKLFGDISKFRRHFANPLLIAREPGSTENEVRIGEKRQQQLSDITSKYIIRRTNELNKVHLPEKLTMVVCVRMSLLQSNLYRHLVERAQIAKQKDNDLSFSTFAAISALRKLVRATKTVAALFYFYLFCIEI